MSCFNGSELWVYGEDDARDLCVPAWLVACISATSAKSGAKPMLCNLSQKLLETAIVQVRV